MLPTVGSIVLYHFHHQEHRLAIKEVRTRPAMVIEIGSHNTRVHLDVSFRPDDRPVNYEDREYLGRPSRFVAAVDLDTHVPKPTPDTWSWPPKVG